jgi:hypothetical protein
MYPNEEKRRYRVFFDLFAVFRVDLLFELFHYLPHTLRFIQVRDQLVFYPKDIRPLAVAL